MNYYNFLNKKKMTKSLLDKGFFVAKNFLGKQNVLKIKKKIIQTLDKPKLLIEPHDIKNIKKDFLKRPSMHLKKKINQKTLKKGYKHYSQFTNNVIVKDPLINFPEINNVIFNENLIEMAKRFLKAQPFIGFAVIKCHFNNKLPENDLNLFHLDGIYADDKGQFPSYEKRFALDKKNKNFNVLIPFHLTKNQQMEFRVIAMHKKRIKKNDYESLHYTLPSEVPKKIRKLVVNPRVFSEDALFVDPINYFHRAIKPKKLRIMLYLVLVREKSYLISKAKKIKIRNDYFQTLSSTQKSFGRYLNTV